jgi:hypothetical protein
MSSSGDGSTGLTKSALAIRDAAAAAAVAASQRAVAAASVFRSSSGMSCRFKTEQNLAKTSSIDILWIGLVGAAVVVAAAVAAAARAISQVG